MALNKSSGRGAHNTTYQTRGHIKTEDKLYLVFENYFQALLPNTATVVMFVFVGMFVFVFAELATLCSCSCSFCEQDRRMCSCSRSCSVNVCCVRRLVRTVNVFVFGERCSLPTLVFLPKPGDASWPPKSIATLRRYRELTSVDRRVFRVHPHE